MLHANRTGRRPPVPPYADTRCAPRDSATICVHRRPAAAVYRTVAVVFGAGDTQDVADDLRAFDKPFEDTKWPSAPCPTCKVGNLHVSRGADGAAVMSTVKSGASERATDRQTWDGDPFDFRGMFHGLLVCARPQCEERVVVAGEWTTDVDDYGHYTAYLLLRFAIPAIPLMTAPPGTPEKVTLRIEEASRVVWADPASAANGLRRAVEVVLDHQKVRKTATRKDGSRRRLSPQERITDFKKKEPEAAAALEAVKWVGNQGSHGDEMTASMVIESAEYLDHALRKLYDRREAEITRKIADVNKRRKLRKQT